ncbi:superoxide dismutase [Pseudomonas oryzihabitans]|nr:superoxide dismutase [Pseudomonas psychrotolerans]
MKIWTATLLATCLAGTAQAAESLTIPMNKISTDGVGESVGSVQVTRSKYGLVFTPDLKGLEPGIHGFHVHTKPNCGPVEVDGKATAGGAAGGHLDPRNTGKHSAPWSDDGHLGELPALYVTADGQATQPVLAPRLKRLEELKGHALMIHAGGDNYADQPKPLGGGGARVVCGVIK